MKVFVVICGCLLLGLARVGATDYPDSLRRVIANTTDKKEKLLALLDLINHLRLRKNDSTLLLAREAEQLALELKDYQKALTASAARGIFQHVQGRYPEARSILYAALGDARRWGVDEMVPVLQNNLAIVYSRTGQRDSAFYYWSEAEKGYEAAGQLYERWRVFLGMGKLLWERNDLEEAERYLLKAYEITEAADNAMDHGYLLFQLADFYFSTENYEQLAAIRAIWDERQARRKTSKELMELPEHTNLLYLFGQIKPDIVPRLERAAAFYRQQGKVFNEAWILENLGLYWYREGELARAADILEGVLRVYRASNTRVRAGTVEFALYQIYKEMERANDALATLESYMARTDSLRSAEIEANMAELQVRYDTEKKEQQIRIQELELGQTIQQRNVFLFVALLLALLVGLIIWGYRQRLAANRKLSQQASEIQAQKIRQLEQENQLLSLNAMIEGQESERIRIARDLHDGVGGLLTTVKAHFYAIQEQVDKLQQLSIYQKTDQLINEACTEVRRVSQNMMPTALQLLGLRGAIEDLAAHLRQEGLSCELEIIGLSDRMDQTRAMMMFRIVQELCNNLSKHARAEHVFIQLLEHEREIHLIVEDDGRGFDYQAVREQTKSLGLKNITSRVKFLNGSWDVDSVPGEGTTVMIRIPL